MIERHKNRFFLLAMAILVITGISIVIDNPTLGILKADTVGTVDKLDLNYTYMYRISGTAPYARFVEKYSGTIANASTGVLSATATWTDTDVALTTKMTTIGGWLVVLPTNVQDGVYDMLIYDVSSAAGSRSNADLVSEKSKHVEIKDGRIVKMSDI